MVNILFASGEFGETILISLQHAQKIIHLRIARLAKVVAPVNLLGGYFLNSNITFKVLFLFISNFSSKFTK